jgi:hypothetical protein
MDIIRNNDPFSSKGSKDDVIKKRLEQLLAYIMIDDVDHFLVIHYYIINKIFFSGIHPLHKTHILSSAKIA